jgi:hypothetical protein
MKKKLKRNRSTSNRKQTKQKLLKSPWRNNSDSLYPNVQTNQNPDESGFIEHFSTDYFPCPCQKSDYDFLVSNPSLTTWAGTAGNNWLSGPRTGNDRAVEVNLLTRNGRMGDRTPPNSWICDLKMLTPLRQWKSGGLRDELESSRDAKSSLAPISVWRLWYSVNEHALRIVRQREDTCGSLVIHRNWKVNDHCPVTITRKKTRVRSTCSIIQWSSCLSGNNSSN